MSVWCETLYNFYIINLVLINILFLPNLKIEIEITKSWYIHSRNSAFYIQMFMKYMMKYNFFFIEFDNDPKFRLINVISILIRWIGWNLPRGNYCQLIRNSCQHVLLGTVLSLICHNIFQVLPNIIRGHIPCQNKFYPQITITRTI